MIDLFDIYIAAFALCTVATACHALPVRPCSRLPEPDHATASSGSGSSSEASWKPAECPGSSSGCGKSRSLIRMPSSCCCSASHRFVMRRSRSASSDARAAAAQKTKRPVNNSRHAHSRHAHRIRAGGGGRAQQLRELVDKPIVVVLVHDPRGLRLLLLFLHLRGPRREREGENAPEEGGG